MVELIHYHGVGMVSYTMMTFVKNDEVDIRDRKLGMPKEREKNHGR